MVSTTVLPTLATEKSCHVSRVTFSINDCPRYRHSYDLLDSLRLQPRRFRHPRPLLLVGPDISREPLGRGAHGHVGAVARKALAHLRVPDSASDLGVQAHHDFARR